MLSSCCRLCGVCVLRLDSRPEELRKVRVFFPICFHVQVLLNVSYYTRLEVDPLRGQGAMPARVPEQEFKKCGVRGCLGGGMSSLGPVPRGFRSICDNG